MRSGGRGRRLLVTVGTTRFDALLAALFEEETVQVLGRLGFTEWRVQHGASPLPGGAAGPAALQTFAYRGSLEADIEWADLVIGHAGAGTVLDVLRGPVGRPGKAPRPLLVVVPNGGLMDGHQAELAEALARARVCLACAPAGLAACLRCLETDDGAAAFSPLPPPSLDALRDALQACLRGDAHQGQPEGRA